MKIRCIRLALAVTLCASLAAALTACWDNHELDALFIVTGIALDKSDEPGLIDITLQISKTKSTSSDSTAPDDQKESVILMKTTHKTVMEGLMSFNRNSSRLLLLQHNQVLLI
ncbi:MAG: hypothetical protein LBH54_02310, partial [Clostridiales bacterium]|nr:hypothetical protein [Clostridiales bacterium]